MDGPTGGWSFEMWRVDADDDGLATQLQEEVWDELRWEPELECVGDCLSVDVVDRQVTLSGTASTYRQKAAAGRAACRVPGVAAVTNEIEVELRASDHRTDEDIAEEVRRVLGWDTVLPQDRIEVEVSGGVVTLRGMVDRDHQRTAAEQEIEPLVGLTGLRNLITVRAMRATGEIQPRVLEAIRRLRVKHVRAEAHGGVVELHGRVHSLADREQIEHAVREIPGVTAVEDGLRIER